MADQPENETAVTPLLAVEGLNKSFFGVQVLFDFGFDLGMNGGRPGGRGYWPWFVLPWLPFRPAPEDLRTDTDLARMRTGGLDAEFFSIWMIF